MCVVCVSGMCIYIYMVCGSVCGVCMYVRMLCVSGMYIYMLCVVVCGMHICVYGVLRVYEEGTCVNKPAEMALSLHFHMGSQLKFSNQAGTALSHLTSPTPCFQLHLHSHSLEPHDLKPEQ